MKKRERRRWLSTRYAERCRRERIRINIDSSWDISYRYFEGTWCCKPLGYLRKAKSVGCNCRGRCRGNPKYGGGICCYGMRKAVVERIAGRRRCRSWLHALRGGVAPDDVEG